MEQITRFNTLYAFSGVERMKSFLLKHYNGWHTRIVYRKSCNDLVITQYCKKHPEDFRQIFIYDEKIDVINAIKKFLAELKE